MVEDSIHSPMACKCRMGVTGFYTRHFYVSQLLGSVAYLLSVAALPSLAPNVGNY